MAFTPKPCAHCSGTSFHILPNMQLELWQPSSVFGIVAHQKMQAYWTFSLVICAQCARTETFTNNGAELNQKVPGAYVASCAAPPG